MKLFRRDGSFWRGLKGATSATQRVLEGKRLEERSQIGVGERILLVLWPGGAKGPKFAGARVKPRSHRNPPRSSLVHSHTLCHLLPQNYLYQSLCYSRDCRNRIVATVIQSFDQDPLRYNHRISQLIPWLSKSRARLPLCSTRRRSMLQRLPPMRKRTARMASTLAAGLRLPVVIPRDTVSLSLSACLCLFFPICPSTAERGYLHSLLCASFTAHSVRLPSPPPASLSLSLSSFHSSCCATSSDAIIHSTPTKHNT